MGTPVADPAPAQTLGKAPEPPKQPEQTLKAYVNKIKEDLNIDQYLGPVDALKRAGELMGMNPGGNLISQAKAFLAAIG